MSKTNIPKDVSNAATDEQGQVLSPEEIMEMRKKVTDFYEGEIPFLKIALEYHTLKAAIEKKKYQEYLSKVRLSQIAYEMMSHRESELSEVNAQEGTGPFTRDPGMEGSGPMDRPIDRRREVQR